MNAADVLILALVALSTLLGLWAGFISGVLSLVCWVAAFWVAWAFGGEAAAWYAGWLDDPAACFVAGYLTCFLGVLLVGAVVGWLLRGLLDHSGLRGGDRFLGMLFGLARGLLLVLVVVFVLGFTAIPREADWWRQSQLLPAFESGAAWLAQRLPPQFAGYLSAGGKALPELSRGPISAVKQAAGRLDGVAVPASVAPAPATSAPRRAHGHDRPTGDVGQ